MKVRRESNKFVELAIRRNSSITREEAIKVALIYAKRKRGTPKEVIDDLEKRIVLEQKINKLASKK